MRGGCQQPVLCSGIVTEASEGSVCQTSFSLWTLCPAFCLDEGENFPNEPHTITRCWRFFFFSPLFFFVAILSLAANHHTVADRKSFSLFTQKRGWFNLWYMKGCKIYRWFIFSGNNKAYLKNSACHWSWKTHITEKDGLSWDIFVTNFCLEAWWPHLSALKKWPPMWWLTKSECFLCFFRKQISNL